MLPRPGAAFSCAVPPARSSVRVERRRPAPGGSWPRSVRYMSSLRLLNPSRAGSRGVRTRLLPELVRSISRGISRVRWLDMRMHYDRRARRCRLRL